MTKIEILERLSLHFFKKGFKQLISSEMAKFDQYLNAIIEEMENKPKEEWFK